MIGPLRVAPVILAIVLPVALLVAALALQPPPAKPAAAPETAFSARRAMADVRALATAPRPAGSSAARGARRHLAGRMMDLGLAPVFRNGGDDLVNVVTVLAGRDRSVPPVVLMAHSDSVAAGPGAADDAAGVAAALEIVRAVKAGGPRRRDLMVVVTDGEEQGLKGAKAFFGGDPLAARVGVVINMEARGAGGRAVMFETHRGAAPMIALLRREGALRGASSLMPDLYRRLPNDTDLTEALKAGHMGLNFAFFADQAAYHTANDTPERLDPRGLQHIGDQALAATRVLLDAPSLPRRGTDQAYADILGGPVAQYPAWAGWMLVLLSAALTAAAWIRARRAGFVTLADAAWGAGKGLAMVALPTGGLMALSAALAAQWRPMLERYALTLAGYGLLTLGALLSAAWLAAQGPWRPGRLWGPWLGTLTLGCLGAAGLQAIAPLDAFMVSWPLVAGAACALLMTFDRRWARAAALAVVVAALAQVFYWAGLMFTLVGIAMPFILGGFVALAAPVALPLVIPAMAGPRRGWAAGAMAAAGVGLVLIAGFG